MKITLPDGSQKELQPGATAYDLAKSIGEGLARAVMASVINDEIRDLHFPLQDGDTVRLLTKKDPESVEVLRHSTAHITAQAVQNLFPGAKIAIGPTLEYGYYYDFDIPNHTLSPDDFEKIEAEIARLAGQKQVFQRRNVEDVDASVAKFKGDGEIYKAELLEEHRDHDPTLYYCVDPANNTDIWNDLCRGPHIPDTSWIDPKAVKLLSVAGAYWRGDEKNTQLQRVYAACFWDKKDLQAFITQREEAEKRDHRKLGKQLHLFSIEDEIGPGLVLWHPNLGVVREELENFLRKQLRRRGYELVYTPHLAKRDLWDISGHTSHYLENMYTMEIDEQEYILKPMNCPMHVMIYKSKLRSYRELPVRLAEFGTVYRYEKSGVVHGLTRVRGFTQDDAHHFCTPEQITPDMIDIIEFVGELFAMFEMTFEVELSTRPEKYVGDIEVWNQAEASLKEALDKSGLPYEVNEGDGAFYGPKIDFKIKDAIGRTWQLSTVQLDFNLPERFDLKYTDSDGQHKRPIMIHRAIFGSLERFAGILIEHYTGGFPAWLAPVQAAIIPIADRHLDKAQEVAKALQANDVRAKVDISAESMNYKIRQAQLNKVPYMLVIGDKESEAGTVAVRARIQGDMGTMPVETFQAALQKEITSFGKEPVSSPQPAGTVS
ncbi:MAG: threonine--tRNA ligase [Vampirovibrio sp.]|nr:threonine--tRNA ligase [Vampirovibrio sp.]